jgi:hypothetical protein
MAGILFGCTVVSTVTEASVRDWLRQNVRQKRTVRSCLLCDEKTSPKWREGQQISRKKRYRNLIVIGEVYSTEG